MTDKKISALRRRMSEDMTIRNLAENTQRSYINQIRYFARFLGYSPDRATNEDVRRYQLHMAASGYSSSTRNIAAGALKFLFNTTLGRKDIGDFIPNPRPDQTLPSILSQDEVTLLLDAAPHQKARAALSVAYGAGLRACEVVSLKRSDIDGDRMLIRVEHGKGSKERYVMLSPHLREILRKYWKISRPRGWLFPGRTPVNPLSTRTMSYYCRVAAKNAGFNKLVYTHMLRHSFATHLLE